MKQVALITGSSRGIGAATARVLATKGYAICLNYKSNEAQANQLAAELTHQGVEVISVQADVSNEAEVVKLFEEIDTRLGPITALVNNVGVLFKQMSVEQMDAQRINKVLSTNVTSYFICCREAIKRMALKHGGNGGAIVNVSSLAAKLGSAFEYVDYAASKAAVDTLTVGLSIEVAEQGIRVNCVRPGPILTDIHADGGEPNRVERVKQAIPMKRGGQPEEVSASIAWLLSHEASYVTGAILDVAGGR